MSRPRNLVARYTDGRNVRPVFSGVSSAEIIILGLALASAIILYLAQGFKAVALVSPPSILASMAYFNWRMVRKTVDALWTPLFAFRTATAVFLGFGGILSESLSSDAKTIYLGDLPYTPDEAAYVFLVWHVGAWLTLLGCYIAKQAARTPVLPPNDTEYNSRNALILGAAFTIAGLGYAYFIRLPSELGFLPIGIIPQSISLPFDAALAVGIFLLTLWALERGGAVLLIIPPIVLLASAIGLFLLTKQGVILPFIFCALAFLMRRFTLFKAIVVVGVLTALLGVLQPMVAHAREADRSVGQIDPAQRFADLASYFDKQPEVGDSDTVQDFQRLSHTHVAAFIISRYHMGLPSEALESSAAALVPRVLWRNKPVTTGSGEDLFFAVSGRTGSALAPTTFADLYWNSGWLGLSIISLIWGALMWIGTTLSYQIVNQRDWFMMPFVLLCFMMGLAAESAFVTAIFIPTFMTMIAFYLLTFVRKLQLK